MNAQTRLRLAKEARALLPFWAAMAGLMLLPFLFQSHEPLHFAWSAYCFGCVLLGSVIIGQEFQHRTMGLLLSQPASRRRIWWEKMFVLGAALLGLLLWLVILGLVEANSGRVVLDQHGVEQISRSMEIAQLRADFFKWPDALVGIAILLLPLLLGFCTGPALTLLARSTIGGVALTFLCPWAFSIPILLIIPDDESFKSGLFSTAEITALFFSLFVAPCLYLGGLFLLGCRGFQRFEDANTLAQDISLPAQLTQPFAGFTRRLTLGRGSALGQLVRKEVRLHLPAFVVAGMLVGLWLLLLAVVLARPSVAKDFLMLPSILLGLGIPVIAGIVSTAEERGLGLLDWHLTLPVSTRRQWCIKVLVALAVNVVLGLLLPGVLGHAASWLVGGNFDTNLNAKDSQAFLIANAVIFCAALYASTAAANSMRALVGTIVLFVAVPLLFFPLINYLGVNHPAFSPLMLLLSQVLVKFVPTAFLRELPGVAFFGGITLSVVWLFALGLANFRRSLDSLWRPVRQMAGFFAVVAFLLFAISILGRSMDFLRSNGWTFGWAI